jgi:ELWxxDGT repeat protein
MKENYRMKTSFWRRWCNSLRSAKPTRPISRARPRRQPLCLEALEDRVTPSLTPQMVLDINPGDASSFPSYPSQMVAIGSTTYFAANDGVHGIELWKSDGTAAGTTLVKDIDPGSVGSGPLWLTNVNGTLFFRAGDRVNGTELWKSDGTATGTVLVKDIRPGSASSHLTYLTNVNGTLFFSANDGTNGTELWKSDGTAAGTTLVKDIYPGTKQSYWWGYGGDKYYFDHPNSSSPNNLTNVNGTLFFTANDGVNARELWKSDGTAAGTVLVKDIYVGSTSSSPNNLTNVNGTLFFSARSFINEEELWKSDGTAAGTTLVKDINPGNNSSSPGNLTNVNGTLFFSANDGTNGTELWKSDGTAAGTTLVKDISPGSGWMGNWYGYFYAPFSSYPGNLTNVNGTLFFTAYDGTNGWELWKSDGTAAGTNLVKDIFPGSHYVEWYGYFPNSSYPGNLTNVNGTLFFTADDGTGTKLWQSDGGEADTVLVANLVASGLTNVNGTLFFSADDGVHGQELWTLVDGPPTLSVNDVAITEGNTGTRTVKFTVTISAASGQTVTVAYTTEDGTATAGPDNRNDCRPGQRRPPPRAERDLLRQPPQPDERDHCRRPGDRHDPRRRAEDEYQRRDGHGRQHRRRERDLHREPVGCLRRGGDSPLSNRERQRHGRQ